MNYHVEFRKAHLPSISCKSDENFLSYLARRAATWLRISIFTANSVFIGKWRIVHSCLPVYLTFDFSVLFGTSPKLLHFISFFSYVKITLLDWNFCLLSKPEVNSCWYAELLMLRCYRAVLLKFFSYYSYSIKYFTTPQRQNLEIFPSFPFHYPQQ